MSGSLSSDMVNASIPLQAKAPAPANPLQTIEQFAAAKNALNQTQLFPGQYQQQQLGIQANQLALQKAKNAAAYQVGLPVVANPNFTLDDLAGAWGSAEHNLGIVTQPALADVAALPQTPNTPAWRQAVKSIMVSRAQTDPTAAISVNTQQQGPFINTGPTLQPTTVAPAGSLAPGVVTPAGGSYAMGLTPGEATAPTQIGVTPQGAPITGTRQQFIDKTGGASSPLGTGRLPPALLNPATQTPAVGIVTGQGPAQAAQQATQGAQSAHAFQDIADQGVQARGQNAVLGNMLTDIGQFPTGQPMLNSWKALSVKYAPTIAATFGLPADQVAANESFDKLANQIAGAQGERSDARLSVAQAANPGSHLSPAGADLIIRQLQGNADYLQARAKLAAQFPDQTDRAGFEAKIGTNLDPRVFQFDRMTPQQKVDFANHLSGADKAAISKSYAWSLKNGLIGAQNAAQ